MNTWQLWKLNKFKLKLTDIVNVSLPFLKIVDWKKTHNEVANFKHYTCSCGQVTLLWFIEKLGWKCKDCSWFNK